MIREARIEPTVARKPHWKVSWVNQQGGKRPLIAAFSSNNSSAHPIAHPSAEVAGVMIPDTVKDKVAMLVRVLKSDQDGEVVAAVRALTRTLESAGSDIHALADQIKNPSGLSDADKEKIRNEIENARALGYTEGVQAAEAKQHGAGAFRNTDGTLEWTEVALFVQREKHRLPDRHHEFIDDMASRTVYGREPTSRQHQYLHSLFFKLGGKIT